MWYEMSRLRRMNDIEVKIFPLLKAEHNKKELENF